jgi:2-C-methyl-D-erythritol 2,4-cyclodiphosphate synthase
VIRTGIGFDAHRFAPGRRLILGGVEIPGAPGLEGHSDADVLTHAIMDALLGAAADGDIGRHFPDTDPAWKDARSLALLEAVGRRLAGRGFRVLNVDATVIAETPRLAPHAPAMRAGLGAALGLGADRVSVKATTVEGMGALGRREGMAALAVATVDDGPGDPAV